MGHTRWFLACGAPVKILERICCRFPLFSRLILNYFTKIVQINRKKINKKLKKGGDEEEVADKLIEEQLNVLGPKPTCYDTLPFQLFR